MTELILWISVVTLTGAVGVTALQLRDLTVDRYELGGWQAKRAFSGSGLSTDVRTLVFRIDGAATDPGAWQGLLARLDDVHEQLSPFGENARRPAVEYRTWWGGTRVLQQAPPAYNRHYLENYLAILERLAGVHPDEQ